MTRQSDELARAKRAASDNWTKNSGRDQATYEHAVDLAQKAVKQAKRR